MGTLAEKLDYLAGTKEAIKQALIDRGCTISDSDTFRSYVNKLSELPSLPISITAVYTQTTTVTDADSLDVLRPDLVVTAHYGDGTTKVVTDYTLSGTLEVGTSTITATYKGFSDTFEVTVEESIHYLYKWDFTESLTDKVNGAVAVLSNGATFEQGTGVTIGAVYGRVTLGAINLTNKTLELDITNMAESSGTTNRRFLMINDEAGFIYRGASSKWEIYYNSSWRTPTLTSSDKNLFANSTMKLVCGESNMSIYKDDTLVFEGINPFKTNLYIGATSQAYKVVRITGLRIYETPQGGN